MTEPKDLSEYNGQLCTKCERDNISGGFVEVDANYAWQKISCPDCGNEVREVFKLCGVEDVETGKAIFEEKS